MSAVQEWISEGCDWRNGIMLLLQYTPKPARTFWIRRNHDWAEPHYVEALKEELLKWSGEALPPPDEPRKSNPKPKTQLGEPKKITELRETAVKLHKEEASQHAEMALLAESGDAKEARIRAADIMNRIRPQLDRIYTQIREWEASGQEPVVAVSDTSVLGIQKMKQLNSARVRASQVKAKIKNATPDVDIKALESKLMEIEQLIETLEKEING